jgi:hypothetical protein
MRGNHQLWGRQDYTEPTPLPLAACARVKACEIIPRNLDRTKPHNWHAVRVGESVIGFVATRMAGQCWRCTEMDHWRYAASDWNRSDPPHAHAVLQLLDWTNGS